MRSRNIQAMGLVLALAAAAGPSSAQDWQRFPEDRPLFVPGKSYPDGRITTSVADPCVLYDGQEHLWKLWFTGARAVNYLDPVPEILLNYAESPDGLDWTFADEPLMPLGDAGAWDHGHVETASVVKNLENPPDKRYLLWYSGAGQDHSYGPDYQIGLAYSADGKHFTRLAAADSPYHEEGLVLRVEQALANLGDGFQGVVADPDVILEGGVYKMWFSSFACKDACTPADYLAFGISFATSPDGVHWTSAPQNPLPTLLRGAGGGQQPSVLRSPSGGLYEMWFTSDTAEEAARVPSLFNPAYGFWKATSANGVDWSVDYQGSRDFRQDLSLESEKYGLLTGVKVARGPDSAARMYYIAWGDVGVPRPDFIVPIHDPNGGVAYPSATMGLRMAVRAEPAPSMEGWAALAAITAAGICASARSRRAKPLRPGRP